MPLEFKPMPSCQSFFDCFDFLDFSIQKRQSIQPPLIKYQSGKISNGPRPSGRARGQVMVREGRWIGERTAVTLLVKNAQVIRTEIAPAQGV
jgi:hypothetical protein